MNITVNYSGEDHVVNIPNDSTILDIKRQLSDKLQIEVDNIRIRLRSNYPQDNDKISKHKINENSKLNMTAKIKISVMYQNESVHQIFPDATIYDLKEELAEEFEITADTIFLEFEGQELEDDKTLLAYGIKENSVLTLKTKIKLLVKFNDKIKPVEIFPHETVRQLKTILSEKFNVDIENIILTFREKLLSNEESVENCGIKNESELLMSSKINVTVTFCGTEYGITVLPDETIFDLKKKLSERLQLDIIKINMRFNENDLHDNDNINKCQITNNSSVLMIAEMTVSIKYFEETIPISISSEGTVLDLRTEISRRKNIEKDNITVELEGERLSNERSLSAYRIQNKSTLVLRERVKLVNKFSDQSLDITMFTDQKVSDLKGILSQQFQIVAKDKIILRLDSVYLEDDKCLEIYEMKDNMEIFMIIQMKVIVKYCDMPHELKMESTEKVSSIKMKLGDEMGVEADLIELWMNEGKVVDDDEIGKYGIRDELELTMRVKMRVQIEYGNIRDHIDVYSDAEVSEVKKQLSEEFGIDFNDTTLSFNNNPSPNDATMNSWQIKENSTLTMTSKKSVLIKYFREEIPLKIESDSSVSDLILEILRLKQLDSNKICLKVNGDQLLNEKRLFEYGIENRSIVTMATRIKQVVKFHDNKEVSIDEWTDSTVLDMKRQIAARYKLSVDQICLLLNGNTIDDEQIYQDINPQNREMKMRLKINVTVRFNNRKFDFQRYSDEKVSVIFEEKLQTPTISKDTFYFVLNERPLQNDRPLYHYFDEDRFELPNLQVKEWLKFRIMYGGRYYDRKFYSHLKVSDLKAELQKQFKLGKTELSFGKERSKFEYNRTHLEHENEELVDEENLEKYLTRNLTLRMKKKINVYCKEGNKTYCLYIVPDATVEKLRNLIHEKIDREKHGFNIIFGGNLLIDNKLLNDMGIKEDSTLTVV